MSRRPSRQCGNDGENKTIVSVRAVNFPAVEKGDRWTKKEMSEGTERGPELALFASWVRDRAPYP